MTETVQLTTLLVVVLVVAVIALGVWTIVADIVGHESIEIVEAEVEELSSDLYLDRPEHPEFHLSGWVY